MPRAVLENTNYVWGKKRHQILKICFLMSAQEFVKWLMGRDQQGVHPILYLN